jgi:hypothetical protein
VRCRRRSELLIEELLAFTPRGGVDDLVDAYRCAEDCVVTKAVLWIEGPYWRGRGHRQTPVPMLFSR